MGNSAPARHIADDLLEGRIWRRKEAAIDMISHSSVGLKHAEFNLGPLSVVVTATALMLRSSSKE
jgi:hypothetical protein